MLIPNSRLNKELRETEQKTHRFERRLFRRRGVVVKVHDEAPAVRVMLYNDYINNVDIEEPGNLWGAGRYLPIYQSKTDILSRFGTIRPGLQCWIWYKSEANNRYAFVEIMGLEAEKLGVDKKPDNEAKQGIGKDLLPPGLGLF